MLQEVERVLLAAEMAQRQWADKVLRRRLRAVGRVAERIAEHQDELCGLIPRANASGAEMLASELIPLADACRFAARVGCRVLAPETQPRRHGAWWMGRVGVRLYREPWGKVLVLAPANYPLFLPGVQLIQAVAAGNAVIVKPAPGCEAVMHRFHGCLVEAGIPADLVQVIDSAIESGQRALELGVDKIVLTGSATTAQALLPKLVETMTPATMELSGCDAVFVSPHADIGRVVSCIAYGLRLNGGASCIAPRRIFVTPRHCEALSAQLSDELKSGPRTEFAISPTVARQMSRAVSAALADGARIVYGASPSPDANQMQAVVLSGVRPEMEVARSDLFGPLTSILSIENMSQAIQADRLCPYSLGASVFGPRNHAEHWAKQIQAGCVVINDIIVPSADPRVAFGGRDHSGWGTTRGATGLLEMTRPKSICVRHGKWLPHLDVKNAEDGVLMSHLLNLLHGGSWRKRLAALASIVGHLRNK